MNKQYKSVPVEPTEEMLEEGMSRLPTNPDVPRDIHEACLADAFEAMIEAAPQAPVSGFDEWWSKMGGGIGCKLIARDAWKAALSTQPQSSLHELVDDLRKEANEVPHDSAETTQVLFRVADQLQAALESQWLPIEAAPMDGTYVIVYQEGVLEPSQTICAWDDEWDGGWWMCCDGKNPEIPLRGPAPTLFKRLDDPTQRRKPQGDE